MKLFTLILLFLSLTSSAQIRYELVIDSLPYSKPELFSKNMFIIGTMWKSANDVVQNSDREAGTILVKGYVQRTIYQNLGVVVLKPRFAIDMIILVKDGKCKLTVNASEVSEHLLSNKGYAWERLNIAGNYADKKYLGWYTEKNWSYVKEEINKECVLLIELWKTEVQKPKDDW